MPARRSGYGQPNIHTRLAVQDKSLFVTERETRNGKGRRGREKGDKEGKRETRRGKGRQGRERGQGAGTETRKKGRGARKEKGCNKEENHDGTQERLGHRREPLRCPPTHTHTRRSRAKATLQLLKEVFFCVLHQLVAAAVAFEAGHPHK
eukprot:364234-Chlamydomonas_euryale.AAC.6